MFPDKNLVESTKFEDLSVSSRLNSIFKIALTLNIFLMILITAIFLGSFLFFSEKMALQSFRTLENSLALGRYKDVMIGLTSSSEQDFENIAFFDTSGTLVFSVSADKDILESNRAALNPPIGTIKLTFPIKLTPHKDARPLGSLVFQTNISIPLSIAIALWVLLSLIYWPGFYWYRKILIQRWIRQKEQEDMMIIASTAQMLAHDVRKPFSLLKMGLKLLDSSSTSEDLLHSATLLKIETEKAVDSVEVMLNDIMDIGAAKNVNYAPINLPEFLADLVSNVSKLSPESQVNVAWDLSYKGFINIDKAKIYRAISNIVGNAYEAMGSKGVLTISTKLEDHSGQKVLIGINNTGSYIDPDDRKKLFQPYFTKGKKQGTGLGLFIAMRFVQVHEGYISVDSSRESGTTFLIHLPLNKNLDANQIVQ